jgi:hypothetical protein
MASMPGGFPPGFMFQLNEEEFASLRLQIATLSLKYIQGAHPGAQAVRA